MAKKIQDENGNTYVAVKPWYKKWWIWVIVVILVIFGIAAFTGGSDDSSSKTTTTSSKATAHKTTASETKPAATASKTISVDYDSYNVANEKTYKINYSDTSWNAATVKVDKVTVYKLTHSYKYKSANDGTFQASGFVRIHFVISPTRDISIYPTQGTAIYSNGEQHEADSLESWDGDIAKGATKSGNVTIPVKSLDSTSSLKSIRFKFDANYDTDNMDDNNSDKTFDITLNM